MLKPMMQTLGVPRQLFVTQGLEELLTVADVVQVSRASPELLETQKPHAPTLAFACAWREFGPDRTCIRD